MAEYSSNERNKLAQKLKKMNIISDKDVLNIKVSQLKQINKDKELPNLTIKDIQIIWAMQEAIENNTLLDFFTNTK